MAAMGQRLTIVSELCKQLGVTRQTLYRHIRPDGSLCEDGQKVLTRLIVHHRFLRVGSIPQVWAYNPKLRKKHTSSVITPQLCILPSDHKETNATYYLLELRRSRGVTHLCFHKMTHTLCLCVEFRTPSPIVQFNYTNQKRVLERDRMQEDPDSWFTSLTSRVRPGMSTPSPVST
jgi:hypothetical protein